MTMFWRPVGPLFPPFFDNVLLYDHNFQIYYIGYCRGIYDQSGEDCQYNSDQLFDEHGVLVGREWFNAKEENVNPPTHFAVLEPPETIRIHG